MRGQKEKTALDRIKRFLFCDKLQQPIVWQGKTIFEYSDDEYKENIHCCTNCTQGSIYGLTQDDFFEITNSIRKAEENKNLSEFPDFVFENGFIEHFQITASKQSKKKGSAEKADEERFKKETQVEIDAFYKYCNENPCFDHVRSKEWTRKNLPEYRYEYLVNSFKTNVEKHLDSLQKYNGCKDISIFLIENPEINIEMCENTFKNMREGLRCDYEMRQEHFIRYMLSRDKNMLEYLYKFKDKIDYIIYYYEENFEIIKVENIPELYKWIPNEYLMVPRQIQITHKVYNISTKFSLGENDEQN